MERKRTLFHHNGYRMRSYTELRWARLLDAASLFYLYEPHLHKIDNGWYLPDFFLPHVGIYLEVKGTYPTDEEKAKADQVMERTGNDVVFLISMPKSDRHGLHNCLTQTRAHWGWFDVSGHELDQVLAQKVGDAEWFKLIAAAREEPLDSIRNAGEVAEEMILGWMDRPAREAWMREKNGEINTQRLVETPGPTEIEMALSSWFKRKGEKIAQFRAEDSTARASQ